MAIASSALIGLALAAAGAGASYYNTQHTAHLQDEQAADAIRNQSHIQQKADAAVNDEVAQLAQSNADKYRRERLDEYMQTLVANKGKLLQGLTPNFGSSTFQKDAAHTAGDVQNYANDTAGLMARMDAPGLQRQDEAFGYGNLATDIGLIGRESKGQDFIDDLKLRAIRRSPGLDALSAFLGGAASAGLSGGLGAAPAAANVGNASADDLYGYGLSLMGTPQVAGGPVYGKTFPFG